uniref:RNA-directed RNA polymerase n=1 Tax=Keenan toti-like virus TaxID=2716731 RepID=A0A6G7PSV2_9VIRU|nr:RNA-dependent RNA polymerase [Keenan toti-like virus]
MGGGSDLLPSSSRAAAEYADLVLRSRLGQVESTEWSEAWFSGLTRKYRPMYAKSSSPRCPFGHGSATIILDLAWDLLPDDVRDEMSERCQDMLLSRLPNSKLLSVLKELGDLAKHAGDVFSKHWRFYVNWELCFGAPPLDEAARRAFADQVEEWVFTPKDEDTAGSDRERLLLHGLDLLREHVPRMVGVPRPPVGEWLRSPSRWVTSGASTVSGVDGVQRSKLSTYMSRTQDELLDDLNDQSQPVYVATVKRERGKHRNIINAPWSLFLQQSFVCDGVEDHVRRYLPMSGGKRFGCADWDRWVRDLNESVAVPIDQSKFDHVPSGRVLHRFVDWLLDVAAGDDHDRSVIAEVCKKRHRQGVVTYLGRSWPHARGVLSGWRITSLLDTVINVAEAFAVHSLVGRAMPDRTRMCFQGDDTLLLEKGWTAAYDVVRTYVKYLPVNPKKFFLDNGRTEYLRYVITSAGRLGYPIRAVASTVVAQAWQSGSSFSPASLLSTWSILCSRGMNRSKTLVHATRDVSAFMRSSLQSVRDYLSTPACMGGFGCADLAAGDCMSLQCSHQTLEGEWDPVSQRFAEWDSMSRAARSTLVRKARTLGLDSEVARGLGECLVAVREPEKKIRWWFQKVDLSEWLSVGIRSSGLDRDVRRMRRQGVEWPPPRFTVDPLFATAALKSFGEDALRQMCDASELDRILRAREAMPRHVWWDWLRRKDPPIGPNFWGASQEARAFGLEQARLYGMYPHGTFSTGALRRRLFDLEAVACSAALTKSYLGA